MDGKNITGGSTILVPAGERMTKTIQISQTSLDYFDFENLKLTMSSICQPDNTGIFPAIEDSVYLSVHFQQMGSNVALKAATNSINLETDTTLTKESRILSPIQISIIASVLRPNVPNTPIFSVDQPPN